MAEFGAEGTEVRTRIVYWGIEGAGKSTNVQVIHSKLRPDHRGELQTVPTRLDPTVTYDALPIELGQIGGVRTRIQILTVPGAAEHAPTRKQLLDQVDGVVFVVDTQPDRIEENISSLEELRAAYCRTIGVEYRHIQEPDQKKWILERVEGRRRADWTDRATKLRILDRLNAAEAFERFLHTKYVGHKRFSLEGAETLIPCLDVLFTRAAETGLDEAVIGMARERDQATVGPPGRGRQALLRGEKGAVRFAVATQHQ